MATGNHPTLGIGKICYVEIPAIDINQSAAFYQKVFGSHIRHRSNGKVAFDDAVGEVSGSWVENRETRTNPGLLIYIIVQDVVTALDAVVANGGNIVQPVGMDTPELTARLTDGNVFGLYHEPTIN
jgi:predicted enzyme related to lactoylglutathione lyase